MLVNGIQLEISYINTDGGVDSHRQLKFFPPLCKDPDKVKKPPFPNGARKNFDKELFPDTARSGNEISKSDVYSLEIRVASVCALLDVSRDSFAKLLHSSLNRLTVRRDLLGIGHIFQPRSWAVRVVR